MRGYEQKEGDHYDGSSISSPVTNDVSIRVLFVLMIMASWEAYLIDVKGAFLYGSFDNNERIYAEIPQGFESKWNPATWVWLMLKTCYGLKQASYQFWKEILKMMSDMNFRRSNADPCLYYKWTGRGLNTWISWVDDLIAIGPREEVLENKEQVKKYFECDDIGFLEEYVGCKVERNKNEVSVKFTQPVLLQSFEDEFELPTLRYSIPAEAKQVLQHGDEETCLSDEIQDRYRSGVGKLIHLMRWSRPEICNAVRELSRHNGKCNLCHYKALLRVMKYCVDTPNRGWQLKPTRSWDGSDRDFEFKIHGIPDASYATCKKTRKGVTGYVVMLEETVITAKSGMQKIVALSKAEAEIIATIQCVQEMLYVKKGYVL